MPCARQQHPGPQALSQARTHSAKVVAPLMPKAMGMASKEGASAPGTAGSCIPGLAAGAHGLWPRCRQTGSALKAPDPPGRKARGSWGGRGGEAGSS